MRILVVFSAWFWFISAVMTLGIELNLVINGDFSSLRGTILALYGSLCLTYWYFIIVLRFEWGQRVGKKTGGL